MSLTLSHPMSARSVPFFLTEAHSLTHCDDRERHHSPQETQSQSSVSARSIVVHMTGTSLSPELISRLAGMYTWKRRFLYYDLHVHFAHIGLF